MRRSSRMAGLVTLVTVHGCHERDATDGSMRAVRILVLGFPVRHKPFLRIYGSIPIRGL